MRQMRREVLTNMNPKDIKVGKTYRNRGKGTTVRTVLAIGDHYKPAVYYNAGGEHPNDTGVLYKQSGHQFRLYLKSFAEWAGSEVTDETNH